MTEHNRLADLKAEIGKVIVGQESLVEMLIVALIVEGHVLLEGAPGLAKTKLLSTLSECIGADLKRVQFTPDLLPSDLIGTEVYRPQDASFAVRKGPVFTNLLLADEINRAPAKVQSALLQAMQEREVTVGEQTFKLPRPFFVLATQNPIEQEGTYRLPEAQLDRFIFKLLATYPSYSDEIDIVNLSHAEDLEDIKLERVISLSDLAAIHKEALETTCDERLTQYMVSLVQATRKLKELGCGELLEWGASPRAAIALGRCARALAYIRGQQVVTPEIIRELALPVLRHRVILSFEAEADSVTADQVIATVCEKVTAP